MTREGRCLCGGSLQHRCGAVLPCGVYTAGTNRRIACQNKAVVYDLLFIPSAETTLTIAADPRHLGARIGFMSVLHTWAPP
jgi:hypothetical protein